MTRIERGGEDLRVKRTYRLLQEALMDLSVQKGFATVTVSDLTKYAGVNRGTFYRHFEDKFDLLSHYARTVYELIDSMPAWFWRAVAAMSERAPVAHTM